MKEHRIYPAKKSLLKTNLIFSLIMLVVLYGVFSSRFAWAYTKDKDITSFIIQDVLVIVAWIIVSIISGFVLIKKNYYTLTSNELIHHKLGKEVSYSFSNILYLDDYYTAKHDSLLFYLNNGKSVFLVMDAEKEILKAINKHATNMISREQFHAKFPNIRL